MTNDPYSDAGHLPTHGQLAYLQIPAVDIAESARFYAGAFGWQVSPPTPDFQAPALIGQWISDRPAAPDAGAVCWIWVDEIEASLGRTAALGGRVIDTAPSYGTAEEVLGLILPEGALREKVFLASKVDTTGRAATRAEFERSLARMKVARIDLLAVHNLIDAAENLAVLRDLKAEGRIRYLGVTVWRDGQFEGLESVMRRETLDTIQVNYAIDNREAADRILPLAADRGQAVMVNVPFGRDRLFKAVQGKAVPAFAESFGCRTWPQFFLKYVLGHPAVTCPIPGMAKVAYVEDNLAAARGRLPDAAERKQMEAFIDAL